MSDNTGKSKLGELDCLMNYVIEHKKNEQQHKSYIHAVARVECSIYSDSSNERNHRELIIWIFDDWQYRSIDDKTKRTFVYEEPGTQTVFRSAVLGGLLIKENYGKHKYSTTNQWGGIQYNTVDIHNRVIWVNGISDYKVGKDIMFTLSDGDKFMFDDIVEIKTIIEKKKKERRSGSINDSKMNFGRGYTKRSTLRFQKYLNSSQEEAKEGHLFDNVPMVIEGGPGTGKTTTLIHRLRYLIDYAKQNKLVNNYADYNLNSLGYEWLFVSPSEQHKNYLKQSMSIAGISDVDTNMFSIEKLKEELFSAYLPLLGFTMSPNKKNIKEDDEVIEKFYQYIHLVCGNNIIKTLDIIHKLYHDFRSIELRDESGLYDAFLLSSMLKVYGMHSIQREEACILIGTVNKLISQYIRDNQYYKEALKNPLVRTYIKYSCHILVVDEAADYSKTEYLLLTSLANPFYNSITLCGDIMQRTTFCGINKWKDLNDICSNNVDVHKLTLSYRQLPKLVDMAKDMYRDEMLENANFSPYVQSNEDDPKPAVIISDDNAEKALWIAKRVREIYNDYSGNLPSVSIFVGDDYDELSVSCLISRLQSQTMEMRGIGIIDCTGGKDIRENAKNVVRIYNLSDVKGMEFQSVFLYDIDKALKSSHSRVHMIRRNLYVGISRAASHLYASFCKEEGYEDLIKYFKNHGVIEGSKSNINYTPKEEEYLQSILDSKIKDAKFEDITKAIVFKNGKDILLQDNFVPLLLDYQAFKNNRYKIPLNTLISNDYIKDLLSFGYADMDRVRKLINKIENETAMNVDTIEIIIRSIMYSLNWIKKI